ncbi:MAG TPA: DHH family phosphoesterase [Candidatus Anaerotruncus excrementipullorum]|uniref:Cyclic-di-AMP phosphodiesterase n=1 Tax=Candidatus Anaerotruncus excrementipullorum TaxID=2838465 RepID=A0A9D2B7E2_9FIRM|nr:DHH family phosphoesterase [Candidatus Anaerotruncus excrementipullorum]
MSKNANLLQSFLTVAVGCLAAVMVASLFFNLYLFYICLAVTVVCTAALWWLLRQLKRQVNAVMMAVGQTLTGAQKEAAQTFPVPVLCCDAQGEILWGNALAERTLLGGQGPYGQSIYAILNGVNLAGACPENGYETEYQGRNYIAYPVRAVTQEPEVYLVYFFDNTELKRYAREYFESRPSVSLILVDNYEELQQGMKDNERARVMGEIEYAITKFVSENHGVILKNERDRFTVVTEERNLRGVISSRFPLLEQVRGIQVEGNVVPTLSIGVGRDAATLTESEQYARQALDMALGRGGDQAAVRSGSGYEFFGGVSSGVEKRTKVKTRIVATALAELIAGSENVLVMGHRAADLDCFGAAIGVMKTARQMGKEAFVVIRRDRNLVGSLYNHLLENGYEGQLLEPEEALERIRKKTLLVICDTHVKNMLESADVFDACKSVVVIDHHRKMVGHIDNAVIFYHEPYASSASEMVAELIQYFGDKCRISRLEAEALLAGIMLDTKNFVIKTGVRTFEAAAFLRKMGADTVEVKRLFANSMEAYQRKVKLVANARVYRGCAIAISPEADIPEIQVTAAQAADELLNISGVSASFVVFAQNGGMSFSARSMGQLNVQLIMEKLGGGGHHTMAGAQLPGIGAEEANQRLTAAIDQYFEENSRK